MRSPVTVTGWYQADDRCSGDRRGRAGGLQNIYLGVTCHLAAVAMAMATAAAAILLQALHSLYMRFAECRGTAEGAAEPLYMRCSMHDSLTAE